MGRFEAKKEKKANPLVPFFGFVLLVVLGGLSFIVAPGVAAWLQSSSLVLGQMRLLPIRFPSNWPPIAVQGAVAFVLFLILFAVSMIVILPLMGGGSPEADIASRARELVDEDARFRGKRSRR